MTTETYSIRFTILLIFKF